MKAGNQTNKPAGSLAFVLLELQTSIIDSLNGIELEDHVVDAKILQNGRVEM